ncbi:hypothetical protein [Sulfitobacter sp.]|uniref:hypothetical protein n=1 Tax=Sulfitobacter sp. TaxID=1903071 RepID=UPI00300368AD
MDDTVLPITDIAFKAGFGSVRRFNSAFQKCYMGVRRLPFGDRKGELVVLHP